MALRAEARSVSHFKEVSYALENKVVELTQSMSAVQNENKLLNDRAVQLEAQIRTWTEKYEKMERKSKNLEEELQKPTVPQETYNTLQSELHSLTQEHRQTLEKIKSQDRELTTIKSQLETEKTENANLKKSLEEANERAKNATDEAEVADLRSQIASLKGQLAQALHTSRRQPNGLRALSPAAGMRNPSPAPSMSLDPKDVARRRSRSPVPPTIENVISSPPAAAIRKSRRNSSSDMMHTKSKSSSLVTAHQHPVEKNAQVEKSPRPTSISHSGSLKIGGLSKALNEGVGDEILALIRNEDVLQEEILQGLIRSAKMPLPTLQNPPSNKEIMFPAHAIGICVYQMWVLGYIQESERLLFSAMDAIQKQFLVTIKKKVEMVLIQFI